MLSLRNGLICVLGGTGFLGRRIVRRLRDHGHTVRIASRHPQRTRSPITDERLQSIRTDIGDETSLAAALTLLRRLPAFPMFGSGRTRLQPADVEDVAEAIVRAVGERRPLYELGGPRIYTYEGLLRTIAQRAGLKPMLLPVPFPLWQGLAWIAELLPRAPVTRNQVELMRIDTIAGSEPGFEALGISPRTLEDMLDLILSGSAPDAKP